MLFFLSGANCNVAVCRDEIECLERMLAAQRPLLTNPQPAVEEPRAA